MIRRRLLLTNAGATGLGGLGLPAWAQQAAGLPRVPEARLLDQAGTPHSLRALCDRPVVIGFFYTGCATVCPPQTAALRALRAELDAGAALPLAQRVRLLSITVDPLGDPPEVIRAYARRFDVTLGLPAGWLMLTGQGSELARVWKAFDVPLGDPEAHSALLWIGSPAQGRWTRAAATTPTARLAELVRSVAS